MLNEIDLTPDMLRQLHTVQLEILIELDRVCQKCSIQYSLDGGTLLGAVRHKGFIPWDDDVDVIMTRSEYERFFAACQTELDRGRFFLQEHRTDPFYRVGYTRIRRKDTVYIRAGQEKMRHRTGIPIDVFVLDNMPDNWALRRLHRGITFCFRKILWSATGKLVSDNCGLRAVYALVSLIPARFAFWGFSALAHSCNKKPAKLVRHYAMTYPSPGINGFGTPAEFMSDYTMLEFEGRMFMAAAQYHRYLTLLYGDYMRPPPEEQRKPHVRLSALRGYQN